MCFSKLIDNICIKINYVVHHFQAKTTSYNAVWGGGLYAFRVKWSKLDELPLFIIFINVRIKLFVPLTRNKSPPPSSLFRWHILPFGLYVLTHQFLDLVLGDSFHWSAHLFGYLTSGWICCLGKVQGSHIVMLFVCLSFVCPHFNVLSISRFSRNLLK
jgi:hypothetical protein